MTSGSVHTSGQRGSHKDLVPQVLSEYGARARALLFDYLPDAEPRQHLYDLLGDYPRRGGRAFRPSLCIATAKAFGARLEDALQTAVSIEMMHNAMLIHDDIEDESEMRRGKPALHVSEGVPIALNVGDMLSLLAMRPLIDNQNTLGPRLAMRLVEETERMARESAEGQAMELGWRRGNTMTVRQEDYLEMVLKKTCWLATIHPARTGAIIGTGDSVDLDPFIRFGFFLGAAFQIQDDLLNLIGDAKSYGKEMDGDIAEGKRTLMMIRLIEEGTPEERRRVTEILGKPRLERTPKDVQWVRARMDKYGCIEHAREVAHGLAGAAAHECSLLVGGLRPSRDRSFLEALPEWVIERR